MIGWEGETPEGVPLIPLAFRERGRSVAVKQQSLRPCGALPLHKGGFGRSVTVEHPSGAAAPPPLKGEAGEGHDLKIDRR